MRPHRIVRAVGRLGPGAESPLTSCIRFALGHHLVDGASLEASGLVAAYAQNSHVPCPHAGPNQSERYAATRSSGVTAPQRAQSQELSYSQSSQNGMRGLQQCDLAQTAWRLRMHEAASEAATGARVSFRPLTGYDGAPGWIMLLHRGPP